MPAVERFFVRCLDDHLAVVDKEQAELRLLNPTAAALWLLIGEGGGTVDSVTAALAAAYDIAPAAVAADVACCLQDWRQSGWLTDTAAGELVLAGATVGRNDPVRVRADGAATAFSGPTSWYRSDFSGAPVGIAIGCRPDAPGAALAARASGAVAGLPAHCQGAVAATAALPDSGPVSLIVSDGAVQIGGPEGWVEERDPAAAFGIFCRQLIRASHPGDVPFAFLHAAAVGGPGPADGVTLFPGRSGCGKSTLAVFLTAHGWHYGGDDVIGLAADDEAADGFRLLPLPLAASIKPGSWPVLADDCPALSSLPIVSYGDKQVKFLPIPPSRIIGAGAAGRQVRRLVFPDFTPAATAATAERLSPPVALSLLMNSGFNPAVPEDDRALALLFDVAECCPCYRLTFADLDGAARCLQRLP